MKNFEQPKVRWDGEKIPPLSQSEMIKKYAPVEKKTQPQKQAQKMTEARIQNIEKSMNYSNPDLEKSTEELYQKIDQQYDENLDRDIQILSKELGQDLEESMKKPYFNNEHREGIYSPENIELFTVEDVLAIEQDLFENGEESDITRFHEILVEKKITQMDKLEFDAKTAFRAMIDEKDEKERVKRKQEWLSARNAVIDFEAQQEALSSEVLSEKNNQEASDESVAA